MLRSCYDLEHDLFIGYDGNSQNKKSRIPKGPLLTLAFLNDVCNFILCYFMDADFITSILEEVVLSTDIL
jgi:hypothetical protein